MKAAYLCLILVFVITGFSYADIIHVPGDYPTIQAGIDAAVDGDTVVVADGTYKGAGNRDLDFNGKAITVKSENGAENCIIDCENDGRGFKFHSGETPVSVVNGFTITNGNAASILPDPRGGGIYCYESSPTITNNIIKSNYAFTQGGGIYCNESFPIIINNTIDRNVGGGDGGGIYCDYSSPTIKNNLIISNNGGNYGGGIYCGNSSPQIINNTITKNKGSSGGSGICCMSWSIPTITNTIVWNNGSAEEIHTFSDDTYVTYSDIKGGFEGEGNIDDDPLFGNPYSGYTYDLKPGSPCINAGTSSGAPSTDIVGRPRPSGSGVDIGAYEQNDDGTLAVELSLFTAFATNDGVIIKWRTESETNNVGFTIYRSESKDSDYTKISFVKGAGNTGMPTDYQFKDMKAEPGKTYFYYLEDVDITGERNKSDIIKVVVPVTPVVVIPKDFVLLQNYPNPFNPETWIPFQLAQNAPVTISIYDTKGQLIRTISLGNRHAGIYTTQDRAAYWDGKDRLGEKVSSGVYYYTLQAGEFRATRRMVIVK